MKWSFKVGRVFGIELRIHITFFLILFYAAYVWGVQCRGFDPACPGGTTGAFYGMFVISMLFLCVVIHEYCHSLMAIHYGAEVSSITLLPIGGISMLSKMPEEPGKELIVSIVGPLSNLVIAALLGVVYALLPNKIGISDPEFVTSFLDISVQSFVFYLLIVNIVLAIFNLIPAFPLDGGRVLRSILAQHMSYVRATRTAVTTGQIFAFILGIGGILSGNFLWIIIAVFIYLGAEQEGAGTEMKTILGGLNVGQAVPADVRVLKPDETLGSVVGLVLHAYQEDFPVVDGTRLKGVLTRANLIKGLHDIGPDATVANAMTTDFPVVSSDAPFSEVYEKMNQSGVKAVPVIENERLLGMVTLEHLSEVFMLLSATDKPMHYPPSGKVSPTAPQHQ